MYFDIQIAHLYDAVKWQLNRNRIESDIENLKWKRDKVESAHCFGFQTCSFINLVCSGSYKETYLSQELVESKAKLKAQQHMNADVALCQLSKYVIIC